MDITEREHQDRQNEIEDAHDTARRNHARAMRDAGWTKEERLVAKTLTVNAECPTCKAPLPVVIDKQLIVRVVICKKCGDEFKYHISIA